MLYIRKLQPRFSFGNSSREVCDCLGLVLLEWREAGRTCSWEMSINRDFISQKEMVLLTKANKAIEVTFDSIVTSGTNFGFFLYNYRGQGHLGLVDPEDKTLWHMTQYGLRQLSVHPYDVSLRYFLYCGD